MFVTAKSLGKVGNVNLYAPSYAYASTDVRCTDALAVVEYAPWYQHVSGSCDVVTFLQRWFAEGGL